jgi:inner membrane protein
MDPLTHALTGAAVGWAVGRSRRALVVGAVAGLLPDLDVLIRSESDPLLAIEHHRGFTHSFVFVPLGGFIAGWRKNWKTGMLAYLTHPLLDAATTYGTQLFWPFTDTRVGLDVISIIDPLFTLMALVACIAAFKERRRIVFGAMAMMMAWLCIGYVQRERATAAQMQLARSRGDTVRRAAVFPTFGNTIGWRSLYATGDVLRMDRIRAPWFREATFTTVATVPNEMRRDAPSVRDLQRLAWFADGWLARDPEDPSIIGDARYSLHDDRYKPVWGIRLTPQTQWVNRSRERRVSLR